MRTAKHEVQQLRSHRKVSREGSCGDVFVLVSCIYINAVLPLSEERHRSTRNRRRCLSCFRVSSGFKLRREQVFVLFSSGRLLSLPGLALALSLLTIIIVGDIILVKSPLIKNMAGVKGKSGRPGGNPEIKLHGFKSKGEAAITEKIFCRVTLAQKEKIQATQDWQKKFREWIDSLPQPNPEPDHN